MIRLLNVATPATAFALGVPESVPPPALMRMAIVTSPVNDASTLFWRSRTSTTTAGAIALPAVTPDGWTVNTVWRLSPVVTSNDALSRR